MWVICLCDSPHFHLQPGTWSPKSASQGSLEVSVPVDDFFWTRSAKNFAIPVEFLKLQDILVGSLEHFLFSHILGTIIPTEHFSEGWQKTTNQPKFATPTNSNANLKDRSRLQSEADVPLQPCQVFGLWQKFRSQMQMVIPTITIDISLLLYIKRDIYIYI